MEKPKKPIAFFCRAKPQDADAFEIFKDHNHVFIGYPFWTEDCTEQLYQTDLTRCIRNPMAYTDEEWARLGANRQITQNRNFIKTVARGSIVVIPRPTLGVAYLAQICSEFYIHNNPPWRCQYLNLRLEQRLDADDYNCGHTGDIAQGWKVNKYVEVSLSRIPGWIRRSLFGRSTYGSIWRPHPLDDKLTPHQVLSDLYEKMQFGNQYQGKEWTLDIEEIKRRLVDSSLNNSSLEVLVVSLLQLDEPTIYWHHSGGPGDGGVDGFGSDENGNTVGILQAKYSAPYFPEFADDVPPEIQRYSAVFLPVHPDRVPQDSENTTYIDLEWIAKKVKKYWKNLPISLTLRIGNSD